MKAHPKEAGHVETMDAYTLFTMGVVMPVDWEATARIPKQEAPKESGLPTIPQVPETAQAAGVLEELQATEKWGAPMYADIYKHKPGQRRDEDARWM